VTPMRWLMVFAVVAVVGCQDHAMDAAPIAACAAVGQQCDLGNGVLGVCFDTSCAPDHTPPCFTCAKQH